ncbi:hypothetical protein [Paenibacillus sp. 276b]|uniref:hypothetical protein n=1 Tax=Paenibacillus sp. 276b TaxID=1566277 RepID=UPI000894A999|nr:hypothetical protein [Paenibacillus sp. 276b]SEB09794.1 hypothetical protein SAMN03159332_3483 [Paenibacillus sp. 276b]
MIHIKVMSDENGAIVTRLEASPTQKRKAFFFPVGELDDLPILLEHMDMVKGRAGRGLCNSKPRKGEMRRLMGAASHEVAPRQYLRCLSQAAAPT